MLLNILYNDQLNLLGCFVMANSSLPCSPQTPPCRSPIQRHRRLDSFPTDNIHDGSEFGTDDEHAAFGMPESISLGAFPVFLLEDSPGHPGIVKASMRDSSLLKLTRAK